MPRMLKFVSRFRLALFSPLKILLGIQVILWLGGLTPTARSDAQKPEFTSMYTPLSGDQCKSRESDKETGSATDECAGVGGFRLLILSDDSRSSLTLVSPAKKEFPLDFWNVVTHSFSTLGSRAEWRVKKDGTRMVPFALIVRVNYTDQTNVAAPRKKSVLSVAKITSEEACVVGVVQGDARGNERARSLADEAAGKPCLQSKP